MNKIIEAVREDLITARKNQNKEALQTLQTLLGEFSRVVKLDKKTGAALELDEDDVLKVIRKNLDGLKENQEIFSQRGDADKLVEVASDIKILDEIYAKFAPQLMSEDEVNALITAEYDRLIAEGKTVNIGMLMGFINKNAPSKFDKAAASEFIKSKLA